jgi:septum formation protein
MELVLASTSPYRRALLERLGVPFRCVSPSVDERVFKERGLAPRVLAEALAAAKAASLAATFPDAAILGGDQIATIDGQILGKPGTPEAACRQLAALAGRSHELITAVTVWRAGCSYSHTDVAALTMRRLTDAEIARYTAADRPFDCAGAYKIEALGIALFERIACEDHTAITGLPLIALAGILRGLGFAIP